MKNLITKIRDKASKYIDLDYTARFLLWLVSLYYFNILYFSIVDKKGLVYSSFLDHYLNYPSWLRASILYMSNCFARTMGTNSHVYLPYELRTASGAYVVMVYSCLGLGLISFWLAFVIANNESLKRKMAWCVGGIMSIWFINCCRVALLLTAMERGWKVNAIADHHTQFNIVAYSLLVFMIWLYTRNNKKVIEKIALKKVFT